MSDLQEHFDRLAWVLHEIEHRLLPEVDQFEGSKPYQISFRPDAKSGKKLAIATLTSQPPKHIRIRTGVLKNELRAILDSLACTLAVRNETPASGDELRNIFFPIVKSRGEFRKKTVKGKIQRISVEDLKKIEALKPWEGGNDLLFALHENDRIRKHQRLILTEAAGTGISIVDGTYTHGDVFRVQGDLSKGAVIAILSPDSEPQLEMHLKVCFSEPASIRARELVPILCQMTNAVALALKSFQ